MEKDLEILEKFINNHLQRDKFEIDSRCGGFKMGKIYKLTELNSALKHLIQVYKEQQAELEKKEHKYRDLELKYEQNLEFSKLFRKELNKKDKIINEMANNFLMFRADTISPTTIEGVKQFFERMVEDDIK